MRIDPTSRWKNDSVQLFLLEPAHVNQAYVAWLNDPIVNRYLESRFTTHTPESTRAFVKTCLEDVSTLFLGIRSREHDAHVGNIKLGPINDIHGVGEVGILVGEKGAWGKGIASAAITMLAEIAREELRLRKITAGCYASNVGSMKAFLRAGFEIEGERKAQYLLDGEPEAAILMGCLLR